MKIEISVDTAEQVTKTTLFLMAREIYSDMPMMEELEDIIQLSRVAEAALTTLKYMCTELEYEVFTSQLQKKVLDFTTVVRYIQDCGGHISRMSPFF